MAHLRGINGGTWTTMGGFRSYETALGDIVLAVAGYATLGLALGAVLPFFGRGHLDRRRLPAPGRDADQQRRPERRRLAPQVSS